jgi:hypothetical protein
VNGDGNLDLVAGNSGQTNKLYLNDGSGGFDATGTALGSETDTTRSVVLGDVDGDGDLDLIAGNDGQTNKLYRNDGNGGFSLVGNIGNQADPAWSVVLGDVDGDGDLDLIAGNRFATTDNKLYLNDGSGGFAATGTAAGSETDDTESVVLGDVDGDGDLDLIAGNSNQTNKLYRNNGSGGFDATGTDVGSETDLTFSVVLGDVDGDGDLDLIAGNSNQTNKLYRNDGSGGFDAIGTAVGSETDATESVVLGDVDGDGDLDLIAGNRFTTNKLYLNDGSGGFPDAGTPGTAVGSESDNTYSVVLGDVDGDGDLDLIAGNFFGTNRLYLNNGSGSFDAFVTPEGGETDQTFSVVLGDVDGDGDLDLIVGNADQTNKLYRNDGNGGFDAFGTPVGSETDQTLSVVLGDVDGDGDLDLIAGNWFGTNRLYLNNGSGVFDATGTDVGSETDFTYSVVLGDVDSDGDLDLVAGNQGETNKLYRRISFLTTGTAVSTTVNTGESIDAVFLDADATVATPPTGNTRIDYFVSNNGGSTWYRAYPGRDFQFPSAGTDLRWKAEFATLSPVRSPVLSEVSLEAAIDETLADLQLSDGTLNPAFSPEVANYSADVGHDTATITVTPTLADAGAGLDVDGVPVTSGQASQPIDLDVGANTIVVTVTGNTVETTTITINRAPSDNADLADLGLSAGTLTPAFSPGTVDYSATVNNATTQITVIPTLADPNATVTVNGSAVASGQPSLPIGLPIGPTSIEIDVTAEDGVTVKTTTVKVSRTATIGGTVSGLAGSGLVLQNKGGDDLEILADGSFQFGTELFVTDSYAVTVASQPRDPTQYCSVALGFGVVSADNITNINVTCEAGYTVGGTVSGLKLPGLVLELEEESVLLFDQDAAYTFPTTLPDGAAYSVSTPLVPGSHDCMLANPSGSIDGADVENVDVSCTTDIEFADGFETLLPEPVEVE